MKGISQLLSTGNERGPKADARLSSAYSQVFKGKPAHEDQEVVLVDLINSAGVFSVTANISDSERAFNDGRKDLALRILSFVALSDENVTALLQAVQHESQIDSNKGYL